MRLLTNIADCDPEAVVIDTNVASLDATVIELRNPLTGSNPPRGSQLEAWPSRPALDAMLSSFGWELDYFDWEASGLTTTADMDDYRKGRRVTVVARSNERMFPAETRTRAVAAVLDQQSPRRAQWPLITKVASQIGASPQMLVNWIRRAQQ
jgi:hypothetical protein